MKDYIKDYLPPEHTEPSKRPGRRNRLKRDFYSDISIRRDQEENKHKGTDSNWNPHDYL